MEKIVEQGLLYDFYGELLTKHQQSVYEDVVFNDLSLSEIADEQGITRQGVHDLIRRCDRTLLGYEEKLGLIAKFQKTKEKVTEIHRLTEEFSRTQNQALIEAIGRISNEILDLYCGRFLMAFESLADKLQNVFKNLTGKGRLSESDVKAGLKEVKMALLEADVSFKVVKQFISSVQERAIGTDVLNGLNPGQMVIKIVNDELVKLMGSEMTEIALKPGNEITVIMMAGLQGAGKTTTTAKIAGKLKAKGRNPLLAACDVYRPAAIEQLQKNGEKQGVPVFAMGTNHKPVNIAKAAIEHAAKNGNNVVIIDTAGRLHIDEAMMDELVEIKENVDVYQTLLVVDAMTGQDAVNVASMFNDKIGIDGVVLTKMDGDTRGGAALSIKAVTGKPILYVGMGEKLSDLEQFYPDRMASRILGMGDVLSIIDKASAVIDEEKAKELGRKIKKAEFDYNDFLDQMNQIKKMGGMASIMSMMPGMGQLKGLDLDENEKTMGRVEAIILSMTAEERRNPDLMNPSRKKRIAQGAGVDIAEVNRLVKQFGDMKKLMKQLPGMAGGGKRKGLGGLGGMFGKMKLPF